MISEGRDTPMTFPESDGEGTDGRGSPGIIDEKNREAEASERDASPFDFDGDDTDGAGSTGMLDEQTREAQPGETGTTRFGMEGSDSDGAGSGGMVQKDKVDRGGASGLASSLQSGGTIPGGGPGTMHGSLGSGGAASADRDSGALKDWDDGEHEEGRQ